MQAFGLELRRANSVKNLYADVDNVLSKFSIQEMQVATVAHALQRMLQPDTWFDICIVDKCIKVSHVIIPKERYDIYHAAHCIHWNQMTAEYRQRLVAMVLDDFREVLLLVETGV